MKYLVPLAAATMVITPFAGLAKAERTRVDATAQQMFVVSMVIRNGQQVIGEPQLEVAAGEQGRVMIQPGDGSHFDMRFTVTTEQAGVLTFASDVDVGMASADKSARLQASPRLSIRVGQAASIVVGNEAHDVGPYRANFVVRPATI